MLVEGGALQLGQVEGDGRGRVLVLAEQLMAGEVVAREGNQLRRRMRAFAGEDLGVDMAGEVLDPYLAEAGVRGDCAVSEHVTWWLSHSDGAYRAGSSPSSCCPRRSWRIVAVHAGRRVTAAIPSALVWLAVVASHSQGFGRSCSAWSREAVTLPHVVSDAQSGGFVAAAIVCRARAVVIKSR